MSRVAIFSSYWSRSPGLIITTPLWSVNARSSDHFSITFPLPSRTRISMRCEVGKSIFTSRCVRLNTVNVTVISRRSSSENVAGSIASLLSLAALPSFTDANMSVKNRENIFDALTSPDLLRGYWFDGLSRN